MTPPSMPDLARLGDDLERATTRSLAASRHRARVRLAGLAMVALTVLATGTAVAAGLFSPKQVAGGMPAGSVIFGNTHPACVADANGVTFHCTLDVTPQSDMTGMPSAGPIPPEKQAAIDAAGTPPPADYTGMIELIAIDGKVAGGCIGRSPDGLKWDCYVGVEAVNRELIGPDLLGEPMPEPARG